MSGMSTCTTVPLFLRQHKEIKISKQVSNFLKRIRGEFSKIGRANIRLPGILFFSWLFENIYQLQWGTDTQHLKVLSLSALLQFFVLKPCFDFFYIIFPWIFLEFRNWVTSFVCWCQITKLILNLYINRYKKELWKLSLYYFLHCMQASVIWFLRFKSQATLLTDLRCNFLQKRVSERPKIPKIQSFPGGIP